MKLKDIYKKIDDMNEQASMNISMSGETADDVGKLLRMMKDAGLEKAEPVGPDMLTPGPMRTDIDKFRDIVDKGDGHDDHGPIDMGPPDMGPPPGDSPCGAPDAGPSDDEKGMDIIKLGGIGDGDDGDDGDAEKERTDYANQPDEKYADTKLMTKDLSGGLNGPKKAHPIAAPGDNPMSIRAELTRLETSLKGELAASLKEKMSGDK